MPTLRELKSRAQLIKPTVRLGRKGLSEEFLKSLDEAFGASGLVKVRFEGFKEERKALSREIAGKTGTKLVQQVGHTAVFYRDAVPAPAVGEEE